MPRQVYGIAGEVTSFIRLSGELRFNPSDEGNAFWDVGMVDGHKIEVTPEKKAVVSSQRFGVRNTIREDVTKIDTLYTLTLMEEVRETMLLKFSGTQGSDIVQASAAGGTATITGVMQRRWYKLGKRLITAVTVKVGVAAKAVDVDYKLDKEAGMLYVIEGGGIADADDLAITLMDNDAVTEKVTNVGTKPKRIGKFELYESDQQSTDVRKIHTGSCEIICQTKNNRGAADFENYDVMLRVTANHVVRDVPIR